MEKNETQVSKILNEQTLNTLAEYVALHGELGIGENDKDSCHGDYSTYSYNKKEELKSLKLVDLELKVSNYYKRESSTDLNTAQWSERNERVLKIFKKDKLLVEAYKFLGGKSGFNGRGFRKSEKQLDPKPWEIKNVKYANRIPKIITKINETYEQPN
ncbi:MAG: hypothetical protein KKA79_08870 [Nanoarchaeota archaeon]|nr:hypothetical protein [Nanoarchaeota archaeon]MCG2717928.1 hypothetical protein [Nanoarchaeota archaeon]